MGKCRIGGLTAAFVLVLSVVVLAWQGQVSVYEKNGKVTGKSTMSSSTLSEGWPHTKVKIDGYTAWKAAGPAWLCGPSTGCSSVELISGETAAGGTFTAKAEYFVGGVYKGSKSDTRVFDDPEDPEEEPEWDGDSPILIPTGNSQAIRLTRAADGVVFDIRGDGAPVQVAWTKADTEVAFLALDRNGNGVIDSGQELFGDATLPRVGNGFAALRLTDGQNQDGAVDAADELYSRLLLWTDRNHNGYSEYDELQPFSSLFEAVGLGYTYAPRRDGFGNSYRYQGFARKLGSTPAEAREIKIFDVFLAAQ